MCAQYFFDLKGYTILRRALAPVELERINQWVSTKEAAALSQPDGEWIGGVQIQSYYSKGSGSKGSKQIDDGVNLQHIYEAGPQFEACLLYTSPSPRD